MTTSEVVKKGIVTEINGDKATVSVNCGDAGCSGCRLSMLCRGGKDRAEFLADVPRDIEIAKGDKVMVAGRIRGWLGGWLLLAGLPCLAILGGIALGTFADMNETAMGLMCLALLGVYYLVIWCFRKKINQRAEWEIVSKEQ